MSAHATLGVIDRSTEHSFIVPVKKIHDGPSVSFWLHSLAYRDIMTFVLQLNHAVVPRVYDNQGTTTVQTCELNSDTGLLPGSVRDLHLLLGRLNSLIDQVPPDTGPRRFGNISFRKWHTLVEEELPSLLSGILSRTKFPTSSLEINSGETTAFAELQVYLLGSFGSPQRLDYGTGHELSFLAFLGGLWKVGYFSAEEAGQAERAIVTGIVEPYLALIRRLIKSYTLEPAGSHGVWGLDDNSFLPYIFGSAQLAPAIREEEPTPIEGSLPEAPEASSVTNRASVQRERMKNMYYSAIGFIFDVKTGPFGEHSPMLFDISGITAGWGKINKGMIKMYNAEVLSKFPVVQHFPFGSLYRWEHDPDSVEPPQTIHAADQPLRESSMGETPTRSIPRPASAASGSTVPSTSLTSAPWATSTTQLPAGMVGGVTRAPWASITKPPPPRR
jgi:serine/threonine-protein phosphatase 2A activator